MKQTIATVECRDFVPSHVDGITFCRIRFQGPDAFAMDMKWNEVEKANYRYYQNLSDQLQEPLRKTQMQMKRLKSQIQKPWYRPWYSATEKRAISRLDILQEQEDGIYDLRQQYEQNKEFNVYRCHIEMEKLLTRNGFALVDICLNEDGTIKTETWIKNHH